MPSRSSNAAPEPINQAVWSDARAVARFSRAQGWIDPSEHRLIERITAARPDAKVLDIGVGGGRTVALLAPRVRHYVGIDFIPALVEASRVRFPINDIRDGDARKLEFDDGEFDIAFFSINGLDSIGHDDRATALLEIRRVLKDDGVFLFSTHNYDGPGRTDRPWHLPPMTLRQPRSSIRDLFHRTLHLRRSLAHYRALHGAGERGHGWAVETSGAHEFGILVHYIRRSAIEDELRGAGFEGAVEIWDDRTGTLVDAASTNRCWYYNVLVSCR